MRPKPKESEIEPTFKTEIPMDGGILCLRKEAIRSVYVNCCGPIADSCCVAHELRIDTDWGETHTIRCKTAEGAHHAAEQIWDVLETDFHYLRIVFSNHDIEDVEIHKWGQ